MIKLVTEDITNIKVDSFSGLTTDYIANNNIDETYLPPYRSESYPSIYKGVTVEMHIVDHCNMNCNCCNHFSPLAEPWFISIEDFTLQIKELKENVSSVKSFILLGGEPTLHPYLLDLCKILRNEFPNIYI